MDRRRLRRARVCRTRPSSSSSACSSCSRSSPTHRFPHRGVTVVPGATLVLAVLAAAAFVPVAIGMDLLLGRIPIEPVTRVLATLAAVCVALPRLAETREFPDPAVLGHRELIIAVTALVAGDQRPTRRASCSWPWSPSPCVLPVVMAVRRIRLGARSPRRLGTRPVGAAGRNFWLFLALLGAAGLHRHVLRLAHLRAGRVAARRRCVLGRARRRPPSSSPSRARASPSRPTVLALLGSVFLAVQLVGIVQRAGGPGVRSAFPSPASGRSRHGGRSALVNNHWTLGVQRDAIDFVQLVDGQDPPRRRQPLWRTSPSSASRCSPSPTAGSPRPSTAPPTCPSAGTPGRTWPATT